jgi:hypothetical protein
MTERARLQRRSEASPARPRQPEPVALASALGNQAFGRLLRASCAPVEEPQLSWVVGETITVEFAAAVSGAVADGAVDETDLDALRTAALADDGSVGDREQLLMAALLDPGNAQVVKDAPLGAGDVLNLPEFSITKERRETVEALGRSKLPEEVADLLADAHYAALGLRPGDADALFAEADATAAAAIVQLTGGFSAVAADAVIIGRRAGLTLDELLNGMVAAASDGTPGDVALAAAVLAIATSEQHPLQQELKSGRIKVDEVPPNAIPRPSPAAQPPLAAYVTQATATGLKGDTLYLPSDFAIANALHWATIIHELHHAVQDRDAAAPTPINQVQAEIAAYRVEGKWVVDRLLAEPEATRPRVQAEIAAGWGYSLLFGMILESRDRHALIDPYISEINDQHKLFEFERLVWLFKCDPTALEEELSLRVQAAYNAAPKDTLTVDGLLGESIVDLVTNP